MPEPSDVVKWTREGGYLRHWCPGCKQWHVVTVRGQSLDQREPLWDWDGDLQHPTLSPSILTRGGRRGVVCHSFVRAGRIEYLSDCSHELAGQTIDMVPVSDWPDRSIDGMPEWGIDLD